MLSFVGPAHFDDPDLASLDPTAVALARVARLCLARLRWPVPAILAVTSLAGLALRLTMK